MKIYYKIPGDLRKGDMLRVRTVLSFATGAVVIELEHEAPEGRSGPTVELEQNPRHADLRSRLHRMLGELNDVIQQVDRLHSREDSE